MFDLNGTVSVVTGGNGGIGLGMAHGLAQAGAVVAIWGRNDLKNATAVASLEADRAAAFVVDVTDAESVGQALAATVDRFGRIDSCFVNAGVMEPTSVRSMSAAEMTSLLDVNVTGAFVSAQAVANHMIEAGHGGSIVFTASIGGHLGMPQAAHYAASKGAVLQLVRSMAVGLAEYEIRVNAISPGWIKTDMTAEVQADPRQEAVFIGARTPMRRWGVPEDFAGPAVFLASQASSFMTGAELVVDGGFTIA